MTENEAQNNRQEYVSGSYDRRVCFFCGLLFGAALGVCLGWELCEHVTTFVLVLAVSALSFAWASARYADAAWEWVMDRLNWFV